MIGKGFAIMLRRHNDLEGAKKYDDALEAFEKAL